MSVCVVCTNSSYNCKGKGISFHRFPKNEDRLYAWLVAVKSHLRPPRTVDSVQEEISKPHGAYICSEHFSPTCCFDNPKAKYLGYKCPPKVLSEDAIPTIFGGEKSRGSSDSQRGKRARKQLLEEALQNGVSSMSQQHDNKGAEDCMNTEGSMENEDSIGTEDTMGTEDSMDVVSSDLPASTVEGPLMTSTKRQPNQVIKPQYEDGEQIGDDTVVPPTSKRARVSTSEHSGEVVHGTGESQGDRTPPVTGVVGFSMETTIALLPRMYMEELLSELDRRNIVVRLSCENPGHLRPSMTRSRDHLEHVLKEVMMREYEEMEGVSDADEEMSDNRSSVEQDSPVVNCCNREMLSNQKKSVANAELAPELSQTTLGEEPSSLTEDYHVHEMTSTQTYIYREEVRVKEEPEEGNDELCVTSSSTDFDNVTVKIEPSTSHIECTGHGSQPSLSSPPNFAVKVKTEPGVEEHLPDNMDDSIEPHVSLPGQLSQELDIVKVNKTENKSSSSIVSKDLLDFVPSCVSVPSRNEARRPAPVCKSEQNPTCTSVSRVVLTQADPDPD